MLLASDPHNVVALELPDGPLDPVAPGQPLRDRCGHVAGVARGRHAEGRLRARGLRARAALHGARQARAPARLHRRGRARALLGGRRAAPRAHAAQGARRPLRAHQGDGREPQPGARPVRGRRGRHRRALRRSDRDRPGRRGDRRRRRLKRAVGGDRPAISPRGSPRLSPTRASSSPTATTATRPRSPTATSGAPRPQRRGETPVDPAYDFVMMALVNMEDPELVVMPTHRVADARTALRRRGVRDAASSATSI